MSITLPKPKVRIPKVPGLVAIGLLAAEFLLFGSGKSPDPHCNLKLEKIHQSTYLRESKGILALKLNIVSECNVPQKSTSLNAEIHEILGVEQKLAHKFGSETSFAKKEKRNVAEFKNLFIECRESKPIMYSGFAKGEVLLLDGRKIPVKGASEKFTAVPCQIGAK